MVSVNIKLLFSAVVLSSLPGLCVGADEHNITVPGNRLVWNNTIGNPATGDVAVSALPPLAGAPVIVAQPAAPLALQPAPPIAFNRALAYVYRQHPQLESERTQLKMLDERVNQAASGFRPTVAITAGTGEQRESIDNQAWRYGDATEGQLTAIQPLFSFGSLAQWRAAKARVEAGRDQLLATEETVLLAAITAWLELCEKQQVAAVTGDYLQRIGQYRMGTGKRFDAGEATTTDLAQADSRLAEAEAKLAIAQSESDNAATVYAKDIGMDAPQLATFPPLPGDLPANRAETLDLAKRSPELDAASYAETAAEHDITTADSALWPSIFLRGSMADQRSPELGLQRERDDSITVNASLPLYQGGAEYSKIREAKLARAKAAQDSVTAQRLVTARAEEAWSGYQTAGRVAAAADRAAGAANQMVGGIEEEQRQGARSVTDVLEAKAELYNAQVAAVQAQKNQRLEAYRLLAATGQLTAARLKLDVELYDPQTHYDDTAGRWFGFD